MYKCHLYTECKHGHYLLSWVLGFVWEVRGGGDVWSAKMPRRCFISVERIRHTIPQTSDLVNNAIVSKPNYIKRQNDKIACNTCNKMNICSRDLPFLLHKHVCETKVYLIINAKILIIVYTNMIFVFCSGEYCELHNQCH